MTYASPCLETAPRRSLSVVIAERLNLRCRCGTETKPMSCKGGCGFICQRLPKMRPTWSSITVTSHTYPLVWAEK